MLRKGIAVSLILFCGTIVVPGNPSVNPKSGTQRADGSPMPIPHPPGYVELLADGSPMPIPHPPGAAIA